MSVSFNGWTVLMDYPPAAGEFVAPGGKTVYTRNADTAVIFKHVAEWWHKNLTPIAVSHVQNRKRPNERRTYYYDSQGRKRPDLIGIHCYRQPGTKVGTGDKSNHRSGTAIDINGHLHHYEPTCRAGDCGRPGGTWHSGFTAAQVARLREFARSVTDNNGKTVLRLGVDFAPGLRDAMHVEIAPGVTAAQVRQAADKIRKAAPSPAPKPNPEDVMTPEQEKKILAAIEGVVDKTITKLLATRPDPARSDRHKKFQYQDVQNQLLYAAEGGLNVPSQLASIAAAVGATPQRVAALVQPVIEDAVREAVPEQSADAIINALAKRLARES